MENKELVILTARNKFFGQARKPWSSLDVGKISVFLAEAGYQVNIYDFQTVVNSKIRLNNKIIFYAFSQIDNYRDYILDVMYSLDKCNHIIPSYDLLKCHENKGYQEIYKQEIGLRTLPAQYHCSYKDVNVDKIHYPVILKTTQGTNGKGVYLVKDRIALQKVLKKLRNRLDLFTRLDLLRRKYFRKKKFSEYPSFSDQQDYLEYKEYLVQQKNFVLQDFVPNLTYDYRVLIAHDRYYVMKRAVKKGDFRASGSKLFSFSTQPEESLLKYARFVYEKFDSPFLSIDVVYDGRGYSLVEFQALHFGMSVVAKSEGYFAMVNNESWGFFKEKPDNERVFANTLISYLEKTPVKTFS